MLLLGSEAILVEGVMVYPDHADKNQFWYLPAPVSLETIGEGDDKKLEFSLIKYKPDVAGVVAKEKAGGFLTFDVALKLSREQEARILAKVSELADSAVDARVVPVSFDEGTVQCVALGLSGGGGTAAPANAPPGTFVVTEQILGANTPSLFGDNNAIFSLSLSEEGATLVERCFEDGLSPIGVIYNLKFTAVRPALDVKITADLKKAYEGFNAGLTAQAYCVSASIDAGFEKLKQDGVIKIEVTNLTTDEENKKKEDLALELFKQQLVNEWFTPSLANGKLAVDAGTPVLPAGGGRPPVTPTQTTSPVNPPAPIRSPVTAPSAATSAARPAASPTVPAVPPAANPLATNPPAAGAVSPTAAAGGGAVSPTAAAGPTAVSPTAAASSAAVAPTAAARPGVASPTAAANPGAASPTAAARPGAASPTSAANAMTAAAGAVSTLGGAGASASPFGVALRLKYVKQEELKTLTVEYHRQDAVQRTFAPQGFFGLMLNNENSSKYIAEIDLTDQFFTQMDVNVTPPKDFDSIGLVSAHVALDYGSPNDADSKHGEFVFDAQNHAVTRWTVYRNATLDTQYTYTVDYHFDPESGWEGEQLSYQLPAKATENQELFLTPFELLGFQQINVTPSAKISWTLIDSVEVNCRYQAKSGWVSEKQLVFRSDTKTQPWKLRLADKTDNAYSYQLKYYLQDGTTIDREPATQRASTILVTDLFAGYLDVQVAPALDATRTRQAFVDLQYDDPDHGYSHAEMVTLLAPGTTAVKVRIPIINGARRAWKYRVTLMGQNEQVNRGPFVDTSETLIIVTDTGEK